MTTSHHNASNHAGLILIHRFPLEPLFHNHRSLHVPIRGYHLRTRLLYLAFLTLLSTLRAASSSSVSFSPPSCPYPLPSLPFPPFPLLSLSLLEDVDDDAFLDCSHKYRGLQSDEAYCLSGIVCDTLLPPHGAVNWSERNSSTLV